jgi:hypothetical protein
VARKRGRHSAVRRVAQGTHAPAGRGKSGGARVIYLHLPRYEAIVLFYVYTKAQRENLSAEQLKRLRDAAGVIKEEFKP